MSHWKSVKSRRVLSALLHIGWEMKREKKGSHQVLSRRGWEDFVFSFHPKICNPYFDE